MPTKVNLDQTYLYKGKHYGPGEVDFPDLEDSEKKGLAQGLRDALESKTPKVEGSTVTEGKAKPVKGSGG